jgi:hypothetical protein
LISGSSFYLNHIALIQQPPAIHTNMESMPGEVLPQVNHTQKWFEEYIKKQYRFQVQLIVKGQG